MKKLLIPMLLASFIAFAQPPIHTNPPPAGDTEGATTGPASEGRESGQGTGAGSGYAPGHGAAENHPAGFTSEGGLGEAAPETTTRGTDIDGTGNLSPATYPNSGQTRHRSNDITGRDTSSAAQHSDTMSEEDRDAPASRQPEGGLADRKRPGYVHRVPVDETENNFEEALSAGSTQTGPYNVTGEKQAEEAEVPREVEQDSSQEKAQKQEGE